MVVAGCSRRGGPLNNLPAGARPLKAVDRGAGWRTGQGLESLGSAPWKVQPARRAPQLSRALEPPCALSQLVVAALAAGDLQKRGVPQPQPQLPHGFAVFL